MNANEAKAVTRVVELIENINSVVARSAAAGYEHIIVTIPKCDPNEDIHSIVVALIIEHYEINDFCVDSIADQLVISWA